LSKHTQLEVLLWTAHELAHPRCKTLGKDEIFTAVRMLSNKEAQNLDKVSVQRHFLY
jgi:hypothetical protein